MAAYKVLVWTTGQMFLAAILDNSELNKAPMGVCNFEAYPASPPKNRFLGKFLNLSDYRKLTLFTYPEAPSFIY